MTDRRNMRCALGHPYEYSRRYDAYFCATCDHWIDRRCSDPDCRYCAKRPERPSEVS